VDECKPMPAGRQNRGTDESERVRCLLLRAPASHGRGLTLVHVRAQLEQLQDTFMSESGSYGGQKRSTKLS